MQEVRLHCRCRCRESVYKRANRERFDAFTARGGRILAWGESALLYPGDRRLVKAIAPANLVAEVKALQTCDFQPASAIAKHVRAAVYAGPGVSCAEYFNVTKLLEFSPLYDVTFVDGTRRFVLYWSGPVMLPGDPMPDTDVKVLARYHGNVVNTFSGKTIDSMTGHACIVGGRVGKGRVIASGPHPEASESTQDFVCGFLRFLTGVPAEPVYPNRRPGAINVAFDVEWATKEGMAFGMSLLRDPRFDVLPNTPYETGHGALDHADALLMPGPITNGYMSLVHDFIAKGGIVVEYDPEGKGKFTGKGFHHAKTYDEVRSILLGVRGPR